MQKIMLLGSGELAKEFVIALKRLGHYVIAVDNYNNAPAMQVADQREIINLLDKKALDAIVLRHKPNIIATELVLFSTDCLLAYEKEGIQIVPSAKATIITSNRKNLLDLFSKELGPAIAKYSCASTKVELEMAVEKLGFPVIITPINPALGNWQLIVKTKNHILKAWNKAVQSSRGASVEVIVEEFREYDYEIVLLAITQGNSETLFCEPIGQSCNLEGHPLNWQPFTMNEQHLKEAQRIAKLITKKLSGDGIWSLTFFVSEKNGVYLSEVLSGPSHSGMVTLAGTQNFNQFELHARAVLGLSIPEITLEGCGAGAVVLATKDGTNPTFEGLDEVAKLKGTDFNIFGKPKIRPLGRMGVVITWDKVDANIDEVKNRASDAAKMITVNSK